MGRDVDAHDQIPGRTAVAPAVALTPDGNGLAIVDARRNFDVDLFSPAHAAGAAAGLALLMDDLALAPTVGADGGGRHRAEHGLPLHPHLAGAVTLRTYFRGSPRLAAGTLAGLAVFHVLDGHVLLAAKGRLFQGQRQAGADGAALGRAGAGLSASAEAAAPKAPAEEGAEEIADVAHVKAAEATGSASPAGAEVGVDARKAKLVVLGPLVLVRQHLIGFVDLFKAGLRLFVPRVQVGVVLLGQLSVCFFQLVGRGVLLHAQDLVVISFLLPLRSHLTKPDGRSRRPSPFRQAGGQVILSPACRVGCHLLAVGSDAI